MSGRQVSYTKINFAAVVNKLEPQRLSTPTKVYPGIRGPHGMELPDQPGQDYRWIKDIDNESE